MADKDPFSTEIDDWLDDFNESDKTASPTALGRINTDDIIDVTEMVASIPLPTEEEDLADPILKGDGDNTATSNRPIAAAEAPKDPTEIDDLLLFNDDEPSLELENTPAAAPQPESEALTLESDDAEAPAAPEPVAGGASVNQADIDALFFADNADAAEPAPAPAEPAAPAQDAAPDPTGGGAMVNQADIDALFFADNADAAEPAPAPAEPAAPTQDAAPDPTGGGASVEQADIDSLFFADNADTAEPAPAPAEPAAAPAASAPAEGATLEPSTLAPQSNETSTQSTTAFNTASISQDDIDALFGDSKPKSEEPPKPVAEPPAAAPPEPPSPAAAMNLSQDDLDEQSEIDAMFEGLTNDKPQGEKADVIDQLFNKFPEESKDTSAEDELDFTELFNEDRNDDDAFTFGEEDFSINADSFTMKTGELTGGTKTLDAEAFFGSDEETQALPEFLADDYTSEGGLGSQTSATVAEKAPPFAFLFNNKKVLSATAILALTLIVGGYLRLKPDTEPAITMPETVKEAAVETPVANTAPHAISSNYNMPDSGGELTILLTARDVENDPLTYKITNAPTHGRISGEPPQITYLPDNNFPGEDRFTFLASDASGISAPAEIFISGPNLAAAKVAKPITVAAKPKPPRRVVVKDITISLRSTESLNLDWKKIWNETHPSTPFAKNVSVQILKEELHGQLLKINPSQYRYLPDPYYSGRETITYRFQKGNSFTDERKVFLDMALGAPPPQVKLRPLAKFYQVGEQVILNASDSLDEKRDTLRFRWEQVGGTPVRFKKVNPEGSIISFVMPSSFASSPSPGPVIKVTAIDDINQEDHRQITVQTASSQRAALWRGQENGEIALEPGCPQGRCPGNMLPWPYPD